MIPPEALSYLTKLVLTNAIYFKGLWDKQFNSDDTYETDFELQSGDVVNIEMMVSDVDNSNYNYTSLNDLQILELDYKNKDLSMIILLPIDNNISFAESHLNEENLSNWLNDLSEIDISVQIPKFKFETKYDLKDILQNMGINDAFSGKADFSGMDGTKNLFIGKALHNAFIEVNEEGTEAAAATAIIVDLLATPNFFRADHPFIFLIQHKETGTILFIGKVMDPST
jgi:serpin B